MRKNTKSRNPNSKDHIIKDRLKRKGIICISKNWIKWAKKYLNRAERRRKNAND